MLCKEMGQSWKMNYTVDEINLLIKMFQSEFGREYTAILMHRVRLELCSEYLRVLMTTESCIESDPNLFLEKMITSLFQNKIEAMDFAFVSTVDEAPLFINHEQKNMQVLAKWRLHVGR
jgi:hypothetical protein